MGETPQPWRSDSDKPRSVPGRGSQKVLGDLTGKGIATDENKVRHEMTRLLEEAKMQVLTE